MARPKKLNPYRLNPYRGNDEWISKGRLPEFASRLTSRKTSERFWEWVIKNRSDIIRIEKCGKATYLFVPDLKSYMGVKDG